MAARASAIGPTIQFQQRSFWSEHMIDRRQFLQLTGAGLAFGLGQQTSHAQGSFPDRSIRVIIPRTPGGSVDVVGRGWSERVRKTLGPSHLENMGGGGGIIGATTAARAPKDGYTLLIGTTSELVLNPLLAKQDYDPVADFTPIGILSTSPLIFALDAKIPATNLKEFIAYAKAHPHSINYGTAGANTIGHVAGEMLKQVAGLPGAVHIPYKGGNAAIQDVLGGRLTFGVVSISGNVVDLHKAGQLRIIAVTSQDRIEAAPELSNVVEQGYPEMVTEFFIGLFAPSGVPASIIDKLESTTRNAMMDKAFRDVLNNAGFEVPDSNREKATRFVQSELMKWAPVLKAAGMKQS
jgi:tripartite-type tricarboxylate transporter receptor subunit TctC